MASDPRDLTTMYNTALTPEQEAQYQDWAKANGRQNDTYDYDMRGAWLNGVEQSGNGHFPDTFKKPNHPTFSKESKYSGVDGFEGGQWVGDDKNGWQYKASPTNMHWRSPQELQDYFQRVEPHAKLIVPDR